MAAFPSMPPPAKSSFAKIQVPETELSQTTAEPLDLAAPQL